MGSRGRGTIEEIRTRDRQKRVGKRMGDNRASKAEEVGWGGCPTSWGGNNDFHAPRQSPGPGVVRGKKPYRRGLKEVGESSGHQCGIG